MSEPSKLETIECATHGRQQLTYVCQHIVQGLVDKARFGFFWTIYQPDNPRPDAWCKACSDRVDATNGEWIGEALEHLQPQVLCGACYDMAKTFHTGGDPWA